ncbi:MAG: thiamine pyrophosphate-dependent enzyme [Chloroflexota bacterium]
MDTERMASDEPETPDADPVTESQVEAVAAGEAEPAAADQNAAIDETATVEDLEGGEPNGHEAGTAEGSGPAVAPTIDESGASGGFEARETPDAEPYEPDATTDTPAETEPSTDPVPATPEATGEPITAPAESAAETPSDAVAAPPDAAADTTEPVTATDTSGEDDSTPEPAAPSSGPRTVGRFIADALRAAGVRHAFTVPGESFLGLLDGLTGAGIRVVATRHEGAAAFMAEAHGQLTGRPAACLATRAVGAANLAIGIHTARQNSTPMFVLIGQVERAVRGREAFQEVDQVGSFGRLAKWAAEPTTVEDVRAAVEEGIRQALGGRPGPVLISLPEDLLDETIDDERPADVSRPATPRAEVDDVRSILQLLASARRPVIVAGGGVLRARTSSDLTRFAELLHVPVVAAWRRADVISNDNPLYLGMAGYGAPSVVRERLESADAMLVIGCRLNEITTYSYNVPGDGVRWAHVDLAPREAAPGLRPPDIAVRSDARAFLRAAVQRLQGSVLLAELVDARRAANETDRAAWETASVVDGGSWDGPGVHPGRTIATLRRVLPDQGILTTDAGNFGGWAARGFRFRRPGTFLGPTSGAMGYGLPAAIAAALVHRDRPVVALVGDGGLGMTMAELETAVREHARVVVVVFDNERYGTIRMHQDRRGPDGAATDLGPIDFAAVARACGARGVKVESDDAFEPALRQALASDRATVIHLALDRRWVSVDQPATR